jgi:hypothetical protein
MTRRILLALAIPALCAAAPGRADDLRYVTPQAAAPATAAPAPAPAASAPAAATATAPQSSSTGKLPDARKLLHQSVEASGGAARLAAISSIEMKGTLSMAAQGLSGPISVVQARPGRVLVTTELEGVGKLLQGYDGTTAWAVDDLQGPRVLTGDELAEIRDQSEDLLSLADVDGYFPEARTLGRVPFEGKEAWKVELVTKHGKRMTAYYDPDSLQQVGLDTTARSILGEIPTTTVFSDFKEFGGLVMPTRHVQQIMGMKTVLTIDSVRTNLASLPSFAPPAAVQQIVDERGELGSELGLEVGSEPASDPTSDEAP